MSTLLSRAWLSVLLFSACADAEGQTPVPVLDVLQVLPASKRVEVGDTFQIGAQRVNGKAAENVTAQASLRSDDETVVRVTAAEGGGLARAVGAGTAHIIAEYAGKQGMAEIVVEPSVSALELEAGDFELANGTSKALGAVLVAGDTKRDFDSGAWGSADPSIASVDMKGVVTGHSVGETVITLSRAGLTTTQRVHVQAWTLQSLQLVASFGTQVLAAGSGKLRVDGMFDSAVEDISTLFDFSVDSDLLTLDGVAVTAGDMPGMATVVATGKADSIAAGMLAQLDVEVVALTGLQALRIEVPEQLALAMDEVSFRVLGDYGDGLMLQTPPTTLKAEPASAVFIDLNSGKISPLQAADVTLSATVNDVQGMAALHIVDEALSGLSISSAAGSALAVGESLQLTATASYGSLSQAVTEPALWTSADPSIAAVSNVRGGRVTGLASGSTTLTARYRGMVASFALSVTAAPR